jgi:predicted transcriptional regulator
MPRRITADIDMQILADVGMGVMYKEIASKYGVSPSYVSKLAGGKKVPDIHIPAPHKIMDEDFEAYEDDIDAVVALINKRTILVSKEDIIKYLKSQIQKSVVRIKMYTELIKKYEGDK